ncbi:MAG: hypothetical protein HFI38_09900 [Lachnospiraceae bacterium]|nr:hypothetical protein [Lachnospiraceae bacterium]
MNYVYPKLSEHDLLFVRLGGAGLGNILFAYARAVVYAQKHHCQLIWPTWASIKLGPFLRGETDKRFYGDLFENRCGAKDGLSKVIKLFTTRHERENAAESLEGRDNVTVYFEGLDGCFEPVLYDYELIRGHLFGNLKKKNRAALSFDFTNSIGVHIRLGDFSRVTEEEVRAGRHDSSLPVEWYVRVIRQVLRYAGEDKKVWIFSDGTDRELEPVLQIPQAKRITFGTSIADIAALSRVPLFIASGSSFSMWARFLGRMSCICYTNQIKQRLLTSQENSFEYETTGEIEEEIGRRIAEIFR